MEMLLHGEVASSPDSVQTTDCEFSVTSSLVHSKVRSWFGRERLASWWALNQVTFLESPCGVASFS